VAEQKASAASRSRFYRWLEKQASRDDPVGDLAYDITHDKGFPIEASLRQNAQLLGKQVGIGGGDGCFGPSLA